MSLGRAAEGAPIAPVRPPFRPTQEIRFAVVLYGGVSLAIYINGVVQELLRLVRATAPASPPDGGPQHAWRSEAELTGTERVYRRLGQMLGWGQKPLQQRPNEAAPIGTRFVVDVLSGSSAGGINGIFLAKALANEREIGQLKRLWVEEGDIAKLVDDSKSYDDLELDPEPVPKSVLNSRRLYWKLLQALDGMDAGAAPQASRLVDELDLWVTTTDIRGLLLPIDLYDRVVYEKRHKNVLHFRYGSPYARGGDPDTGVNDFSQPYNPFLAFAGRATSAFPFAFEPMALNDIDSVVRADLFREYAHGTAGSPRWRKFFDDYVRARRRPEDEHGDDYYYAAEAFGDGGYLDNKPFSWATKDLARRRADLPVDRRLIYIEPDPVGPRATLRNMAGTHPGEEPERPAWARVDDKPDALENVRAAVLTLPRTEPIRDDLEALIRRNREIARVRDIATLVDRTANEFPDLAVKSPPLEEWRRQSLKQILRDRGTCGLQYVAYHRVKIAGVLDDFAELLTLGVGLNVDSDEYSAMRCLVQAWSDRHYPDEPKGKGELSQNEFLLRFDVRYRLRRLNFVNDRIEQLLRFDPQAVKLFERFVPITGTLSDFQGEVDRTLRAVKPEVNALLVSLRGAARGLRGPVQRNPVGESMRKLQLDRGELLGLLHGAMTKEESVERARRLLDSRALDAPITNVSEVLASQLKPVFVASSDAASDALEVNGPTGPQPPPTPEETAHELAMRPLRHFYTAYESYDAILLPLSFGLAGETDPVEIIRVSPQDAPSLIDEGSPGDGRRKLAGVEIGHFGGFFERAWRRNDILWGRLDAAERIIDTMLLPGSVPPDLRASLLKEAQLEIIREELTSNEPLTALMTRTLMATRSAEDDKSLESLVASERSDEVQQALESALDPEAVWNHLNTTYQVSQALDNRALLSTVGRATQVTGRVLEGISDEYKLLRKPARWGVRFGQVLWGLVEMATPRTLPQILFRYWLPLFVLISALMIAGGALFGSPATSKAGWVLLALVLGWRLAVWLTQDLIRQRRGWALGTVVILVALVVGLAVTEIVLHLDSDVADLLAELPDPVDDAVRWLWPWDIPERSG